MRGADLLCATLGRLGVEHVFGLPGSQNVGLYEALRRSGLRAIVPTHELAASFMACGYHRASGRPGVLVTIPGPGFTYALTGIAEAKLDSAAVVYVVGRPASSPGRRFQLQAIDQAALLRPLAKAVLDVDRADDMGEVVTEAYRLCQAGEPGPVVVHVDGAVWSAAAAAPAAARGDDLAAAAGASEIERVAVVIAASPRLVLYAGQGALDAAASVLELAEALGCPVATTTSGRGVVPEDHPLAVRSDIGGSGRLRALLEEADLVLALGVKFSHNGARGFRIQIDPKRLVHVDASAEVLGANFAAEIAVCSDVPAFVRALLASDRLSRPRASGWLEPELAAAHAVPDAEGSRLEPAVGGVTPPSAGAFFGALRQALPRDAILVTDSGLHQMLARRHFPVYAPRGLIVPTDFQSMGFCLPAAIAAKLAAPGRRVVALLGDGGMAMSGLELLTAVRERVPLTVIVFNDGHLGLIRLQQLEDHGRAHGTTLANPDFAQLAASLGADHVTMTGPDSLREALGGSGVTLLEVAVADSTAILVRRLKSLARETVERVAGSRWLDRWRRRGPRRSG